MDDLSKILPDDENEGWIEHTLPAEDHWPTFPENEKLFDWTMPMKDIAKRYQPLKKRIQHQKNNHSIVQQKQQQVVAPKWEYDKRPNETLAQAEERRRFESLPLLDRIKATLKEPDYNFHDEK